MKAGRKQKGSGILAASESNQIPKDRRTSANKCTVNRKPRRIMVTQMRLHAVVALAVARILLLLRLYNVIAREGARTTRDRHKLN